MNTKSSTSAATPRPPLRRDRCESRNYYAGSAQHVHDDYAAKADPSAALAKFVLDVAGGKHGLGAAVQVAFIEPFLNALLAAREFPAYSGVHSNSFS